MTHLKILVLAYERKEITEICFTGLQRNIQEFERCGIRATVYVSTDAANAALCDLFGFEHDITDPKPIGKRLNDAVDECLNEHFDYLMQMGSDDLLTTAGVYHLSAMITNGCPMFGFNSLYVVKRQTRKMKRYTALMVFGAGRCISRNAVINSIPLWRDNSMRGLDGESQTRLNEKANVRPLNIVSNKPCIVDIKSSVNINTYESFKGKDVDIDYSICPEMKMI
jgi:hypothetical protein